MSHAADDDSSLLYDQVRDGPDYAEIGEEIAPEMTRVLDGRHGGLRWIAGGS